ncbi:MAG: MarR family transcriptional regulator [Reichenbachiella sp.]
MGLSEDIKQPKFKSEFEKVLVNLMFTNNWLNEQEFYMFKPHGITKPQYNVLRILRGQQPKAVTINLIIDRMLDRMSNVSRIVDKLVLKNLVTRVQNDKDRRAVDVKISEKGMDLLAELDKDMARFMEKLNVLDVQEAAQINSFLDRLRGSDQD